MESNIAIPHLHQFFGVWAIYEQHGEALYSLATGLDLSIHLQSPQAAAARERGANPAVPYVTSDGIAVIEMDGALQKQESSLGGTSTVGLRKQIRAVVKSDAIKAIMLKIDSPGGTAAGTMELADEIFNARKHKPVWTYFEDLGASAAYWAGSQADHVLANASALVGSIGTYMTVRDTSQAHAAAGIKVHVIRAGDFKGVGTNGTEVTPEQLDELQAMVNEVNSHFISGVVRGRKMTSEQVQLLADGRIHPSSKAQQLGLIDGVSSFDDALTQLSSSLLRRQRMSDAATPERKAATVNEIKAGCPGATDSFIVAQLGRGATLAESQGDWLKQLAEDNAELQAKLTEATAKADSLEAASKATPPVANVAPGVAPVAASASDAAYDNPKAKWDEEIGAKVKAGIPRQRAVQMVNRENPGLREAMLSQLS